MASCDCVESVELDDARRVMRVTRRGGLQAVYPYLWMRDCCQCPVCFHPASQARTYDFINMDPNSRPTAAQVRGNGVTVTWDDGHEGVLPGAWLWERRFTPDARRRRLRLLQRAVQLWTPPHTPHTMTFNELMDSELGLYRWITLLEETGLVVVTGAPRCTGQVANIARRVCGYLRPTVYGETFSVKSKVAAASVAYTTHRLLLHIDSVYYNTLPGMQMLHCIQQTPSEGGANQLVDGFRAAEQLRTSCPDAFRILTSTQLNFFDKGTDRGYEFFTMSTHPTIELDAGGQVKQINFSTHSRDSHLNVPLEQVEPLYRALLQFSQLLYHQDNMVHYKMDAGDVLTFDNRRVLHGRSAYTATTAGDRELEGGYMDWDELHSMRRVLAARLDVPIEEY